MSLWEKWEREKLEKQGVKVEYPRDVDIHETHPKSDIRKQIYVVAGITLACFLLVYAAIVFEALYSGRRWSDTYIVRLFATKEAQRETLSNNP